MSFSGPFKQLTEDFKIMAGSTSVPGIGRRPVGANELSRAVSAMEAPRNAGFPDSESHPYTGRP